MIYIIGDVHGCYKSLLALVEKLPNKNAKIVFVGDLIDRGKDSKEVVEFVKSNNYECVLGNHEKMMLDAFEYIDTSSIEEKKEIEIEGRCLDSWLDVGGSETVESYVTLENMKEHVDFIKSFPLYIEYKNIKDKNGRYLVVSHSHVFNKWKYRNSPKNSEDYKSFEHAVLWSRYKSFDNKDIFNVFGHTPTQTPGVNEFKASIDLGCFYKKMDKNVKLCALEFPSMKIFTQENIED